MNIKVIFVIHKSFSAVFKMSIDVCVSEVSVRFSAVCFDVNGSEHTFELPSIRLCGLFSESSVAKRWQESIKSVKSPRLEIQKQSQRTNMVAVFLISGVFYNTIALCC